MPLSEVSSLLWRERELLDTLNYRLGVQELVLQSGRLEWLERAVRDIEAVQAELAACEVLRAEESRAAAESLGLDPEAGLAELADAAPEPWGELLSDHRTALASLMARLRDQADANKGLLRAGSRYIQDTLMGLTSAVGYDDSGAGETGASTSRLVDEQA